MFGNVRQDMLQVCLWIQTAELGSTDQGLETGRAFSAGITAGKQIVFPA
jgi:hypothetical protein